MESTPTQPSADADPASPGASGAGHGRLLLVLLVAAGVVLVDVVSKAIVVARLEGHDPVRLLGGLVKLTVVRNSGAAFSLGTGFTFVFFLIAAAVSVIIVRQARRLRSAWWAVALGALLGGALGNAVCRTFRSPSAFQGHVVDWIELPHYPVFNVADMAITFAGVTIVVLTVLGIGFDGTRAPKAAAPEGPAPDDTAPNDTAPNDTAPNGTAPEGARDE